MIMRYFGGGVGHLGNAQQHQVNCEPPDSNTEPEDSELEEEMEVTSDDGGNNASASGPGEVEDIIMNYNSEVENSDDEQPEGSGTDSLESDSLSGEGSGEDSDEDLNEGIERTSEDSDDDGYGSF